MAENDALRLAELLGDDAFFPAECSQARWHKHKDPLTAEYKTKVGGLCPACLSLWIESVPKHAGGYETLLAREREAKEHADDPNWHPEWRVGRGEPKPLDTSFDTLEPFLIKALDKSALGLDIHYEGRGRWRAALWRYSQGSVYGYGSSEAAAIVAALLEVADHWRWGREMVAD